MTRGLRLQIPPNDCYFSAWCSADMTIFSGDNPYLLSRPLAIWTADTGHLVSQSVVSGHTGSQLTKTHGHAIVKLWVTVHRGRLYKASPLDGLTLLLENRVVEHGQGFAMEIRGPKNSNCDFNGDLIIWDPFLYIVLRGQMTWYRPLECSQIFGGPGRSST
ncbi:hypothetical protein BJX61DRAFT_530441 [Aspergillus egyptiacus]|nr:hypothetical protein BJX61DRAFT_530441 [Aspergillus egyptiacus]